MDTVIVEVDGTWRSEDNKHGNAKQVIAAKLRASEAPTIANGDGELRKGSAAPGPRSLSSKDGTPFEAKPDLASLTNRTLAKGKSRTPAEVIDLDGDDDDDDRSGYMPSRPSIPIPMKTTQGGHRAPPPSKTAGAVIDLTLSESSDDDIDAGPIPYQGNVNGSAALKRRAESDWEDSGGQKGRWDDGVNKVD